MSALRRGDVVTADRVRNYSILLLAMAILSILWLVAHTQHLRSLDGQPLGTDFSNIYAAGRLALDHRAADAYHWDRHHAMEKQLFGADVPFYSWSYPPPFLLIATLCALVPYAVALACWQASTLGLYVIAMRRIADGVPGWLLPSLAFPAVFINICNGHNGLLSAFLFGFGLVHLEKRPVLAGLLLGALCYKPQFGLLLPLVLLASGRWRALFAAAVSVAGLCAVVTLWFGEAIWPAFTGSLHATKTVLLEQDQIGWYKIQSLFSAVRNLGGSVEAAYLLQGLLTAGVMLACLWLWRRPGAFAFKAPGLIAGSLLATPYILDYDFPVLAPALAFLAVRGQREGFLAYEKILLVAVGITPLIARTVMKATDVPLGLLSLLALFLFCIAAAHNNACRPPVGAVKE